MRWCGCTSARCATGAGVRDARTPEHGWQTLPVQVAPVLPGTMPVLRWFAEERGFGRAHRARKPATRWLHCRWTGDEVKLGTHGLVPAIAQELGTNDVLMFASGEPRGPGETQPNAARRFTGAARAVPVAQGRGVRPHPEGARDPPRLRPRRGAAEGHATRPRAGHRPPHRPPFLLSPAASEAALERRRAGAAGSGAAIYKMSITSDDTWRGWPR